MNSSFPPSRLALEELFVNRVIKSFERKNSKEKEVTSGWFNTEEMASTLGWSK